jgi:hypothetical protein
MPRIAGIGKYAGQELLAIIPSDSGKEGMVVNLWRDYDGKITMGDEYFIDSDIGAINYDYAPINENSECPILSVEESYRMIVPEEWKYQKAEE